MAFKDSIRNTKVQSGTLLIVWLGQAGFLIKTPGGKTLAVDPYLTDSVYHLMKKDYGYGFKRMTAPLFEPGEVEIDYLFCSHEHGDHLDTEALPVLLSHTGTVLYGNEASIKVAVEAGACIDKTRIIKRDETADFDEFKLMIMAADHGELSKEAMGFVFDFEFVKIYYSGDTCYNKETLQKAIDLKPEVALLPINGAFGNLNAMEAAVLAADLNARLCIPHHFWTFPMHKGEKGDPMDAVEAFAKLAPHCELKLLTPGEILIYPYP